MRGISLLMIGMLAGCKDETGAVVEGSAMGISLGETPYVFSGGPFIVVAASGVDCMDLVFVRTSYQEGNDPTEGELDIKFLQIAFTSGEVTEGQKSVGLGASVTSTLVNINNGTLEQDRATAGSATIESIEEEGPVIGDFQDLTFADGSLSGTFQSEWCINLKDR